MKKTFLTTQLYSYDVDEVINIDKLELVNCYSTLIHKNIASEYLLLKIADPSVVINCVIIVQRDPSAHI